MEYGLIIYGKAPKSLLNKIKTILNSAIRLAVGAFRTTPINNLLYESNFLSIPEIRDYLTFKSFKHIFYRDKSPLSDTTNMLLKKEKYRNISSTLNNIIKYCRDFDIPINNKIKNQNIYPHGIL